MPNGKDIEEEVMKEESKKIHEEPIDTVAQCPRCKSNKINWVFTKRGVSIKCKSCGFDTHYLEDVLSHRKRELEVIPILKKIFPQLTFVENIPIDTNILTGKIGRSPVRYDFGIFLFGEKIAKCKVSVCQNITRERYLTTEEQYVQGRPKVFEYLNKIDALLIFYFPDEEFEMNKMAIAKCSDIKRFSNMTRDRFNNEQYHVPKEIRKVIIKTLPSEFKELIFKDLYEYITKNIYVI